MLYDDGLCYVFVFANFMFIYVKNCHFECNGLLQKTFKQTVKQSFIYFILFFYKKENSFNGYPEDTRSYLIS